MMDHRVLPRTQRCRLHRSGVAVLACAALGLVATGCAFGTDDGGEPTEAGSSDTTETTAAPEGETTSTTAGGDEIEPQQEEAPPGALLLVMDASGSMNEDDAGGRPRIDAAKEALHEVVNTLPDGLHVGLRVFGHRVPNTDQANGCRDTELIAPVAPLDRDALNAAIDGYQAVGFTPIGLSLQEAGNDLPPEGPRSIVVVSDGEDTCGTPDACQVARDLRAAGAELVVHTVGMALGGDEAARTQLSCIADAGGGEFYDLDDVGDLAGTLGDVVDRESRRYEVYGAPLEGAPVPAQANTGSNGTAHSDQVVANEVNYYRFEIQPGSEVQPTLTLAPHPDLAHDTSRTCSASVSLTDSTTNPIGDFVANYGRVEEAVVAQMNPTVVDHDEVFVKIAAGCSNASEPEIVYDIQFQLDVVG